MRLLMTALLMGGMAASLGAQGGVTIDPGMSREQVVAKLGEPLSVRMREGHTYLFYKNGCEKTCGMNDLVVLDSGKVVDAIFRATGRKYSGTSSSPRMIGEVEAKRGTGSGAPLAMPAGDAKPEKAAPPPKKTAPTVPPSKKTEVPATTKAATPPPSASAKKAETAPAKKDTTKKKPPAELET